jgi:hypothetical protein
MGLDRRRSFSGRMFREKITQEIAEPGILFQKTLANCQVVTYFTNNPLA